MQDRHHPLKHAWYATSFEACLVSSILRCKASSSKACMLCNILQSIPVQQSQKSNLRYYYGVSVCKGSSLFGASLQNLAKTFPDYASSIFFFSNQAKDP
ncbi:hypothetical protein Tco_0013353 [Tanacetum coccineum]